LEEPQKSENFEDPIAQDAVFVSGRWEQAYGSFTIDFGAALHLGLSDGIFGSTRHSNKSPEIGIACSAKLGEAR